MREYIVDLGYARSKDDFHDAFQASLNLPEYYGRNLDALYDCLSTMFMYDEVCIVLTGTEHLPEEMIPYAGKLIKVLEQVADEYQHEGNSEFSFEIREAEGHSEPAPVAVYSDEPLYTPDLPEVTINPFVSLPKDNDIVAESPAVTTAEAEVADFDVATNEASSSVEFTPSEEPVDTEPVTTAEVVANTVEEVTDDSEKNSSVVSPIPVITPIVVPEIAPLPVLEVEPTDVTEDDDSDEVVDDRIFTMLFEDNACWDELFKETYDYLKKIAEGTSANWYAASKVVRFCDKIEGYGSEEMFMFLRYEAIRRGNDAFARRVMPDCDSYFYVADKVREMLDLYIKEKSIPDYRQINYDYDQFYEDFLNLNV